MKKRETEPGVIGSDVVMHRSNLSSTLQNQEDNMSK